LSKQGKKGDIEMITTPCSRNSDPRTSHLADREITLSGERDKQIQLTTMAVKTFPDCTSRELAHNTDLDRYMLARRLSEAPQVIKTGERKCKHSNRMCCTWGLK